MNKRTATDTLAQFCAEQCLAFNPQAWTAPGLVDRNTLKEIARYLAQTSWYGHEEELERIVKQVADGSDALKPPRSSEALVDLAYFSVAVRCRIAALEGKCSVICLDEACRFTTGNDAVHVQSSFPQTTLDLRGNN